MLGDKLRFRFAKSGALRLLSHHDLMRCMERMLRRAAIPFKSTAGFHPTPRFVFALSLPLGVIGTDEVVEIELTRELDAEGVRGQLNTQAPAGLTFSHVSVVPMKATAIPRRVVYELSLPADRLEDTTRKIGELLAHDKLWVERLRPSPKRLNIRPYVRGLAVTIGHVDGASLTESRLHMDLWVTQTGTARAEELIRRLALADLLDAGAVLMRTRVEIRDELHQVEPADVPPDGPADSMPLDPATIAALTRQDDEANQPGAVAWSASPGGAVVE